MQGVTYSPTDPEILADPFGHYAELRRGAAAQYLETDDLWVVSRYEHVDAALRSPGTLSSKALWALFGGVVSARQGERPDVRALAAAQPRSLIAMDPPDHVPLRRLAAPMFTKKAVDGYAGLIRRICDELTDELLEQRGELFAYALSFAVVALFWWEHHRLLGRLARYDGPFIFLNLVLLALVALVPYPSEVLGEYPNARAAVVFYAVVLCAASTALGGLWAYAASASLLAPAAAPHVTPLRLVDEFVPAIVFGASIPILFASTTFPKLLWFLLFFRRLRPIWTLLRRVRG
jgi:uncharacterized membrane protein